MLTETEYLHLLANARERTSTLKRHSLLIEQPSRTHLHFLALEAHRLGDLYAQLAAHKPE